MKNNPRDGKGADSMSRLSTFGGGGVMISDGAWGTQFLACGLSPGQPSDLWNHAKPESVLMVARSYVEAGSQIILTNTFRCNAVALAGHGASSEVASLNRRGGEISREAAGGERRVFGSMGPTGKILSVGEIEESVVRAAFEEQAGALAAAGVDALLLETFSDVDEARVGVRAALATGLPVIVSFAFDSGKNKDRTMMGVTPEQAAEAMVAEGADAIGANCGAGPDAFVAVCRRLKIASGLPVWIKPNAGMPVMRDGKAVYAAEPDLFADFLPQLVTAGASFVGGCCGTSPDFIRALTRAAQSCASS